MNDSQKRAIFFTFEDIHRRMADLEATLAQSLLQTPFSSHVNDLSPTEGQVVHDYFARMRSLMLDYLKELGIPLESRRTSVRWAFQCGLTFLSIDVAEISPERMRGYGELEPADRPAIERMQHDLNRAIDRISSYLRQSSGQDLRQRLEALERTSVGAKTLTLLERAITRWGLVEFQPQLDMLVHRLESPQFEIAVFGRVSSGKSSLLNHLAGMDVLPVGVTPITAVPTRLVRGEVPGAIISFAEMQPRRIDVSELRDYASEEGNPGNRKHVISILVTLPSPRLCEGVVFVDTPGIGSLARAGSAETFAYLPRCDLGVVLIDAASTLNQDDLALLRLLFEAGIPAQALVSKSDLLSPAEQCRVVSYISDQLRRELGFDLPVHLVSTIGPHEALLTKWFDQEIAPLLERHRTFAEASLRRKAAHLRESVIAAMETLAARQGGRVGNASQSLAIDVAGAKRILRSADDTIRLAKARLSNWTADDPAIIEVILRDGAKAAAAEGGEPSRAEGSLLRVVQDVLTERSQVAFRFVENLQKTLAEGLTALQRAAPLLKADPNAIRDLVFSGLPPPDASLVLGASRFHRPWWAAAFPPAAVWATRKALERQLAPSLRRHVELYDRQLRAWLKDCGDQLIGLYESQAEVLSQQLRRLTAGGEIRSDAEDLNALVRAVAELQRDQAALAPESSGSSIAATATGTGSLAEP